VFYVFHGNVLQNINEQPKRDWLAEQSLCLEDLYKYIKTYQKTFLRTNSRLWY